VKKISLLILVIMCVSFLNVQGIATTIDLPLADWSEASPLGGVEKIYGNLTGRLIHSGWYYTDQDTVNGYLKFDLSTLAPAAGFEVVVNSATLKLYSSSETGETFSDDLYSVADDSWTKAGVDYTNKPELGTVLDNQMYPGAFVAYNFSSSALASFIGQEINGDGVASLGIKAGADCTYPGGMRIHQIYAETDETHWSATYLSLDYDIVPEPATVCILGFGAILALRKRK